MVKSKISKAVIGIEKSNYFEPSWHILFIGFYPLLNIITLAQVSQCESINIGPKSMISPCPKTSKYLENFFKTVDVFVSDWTTKFRFAVSISEENDSFSTSKIS